MEDRHLLVGDLLAHSAGSGEGAGLVHAAVTAPNPPALRLFALFDGHGGPYTAEFAAGNMVRYLTRDVPSLMASPTKALHAAFLECDREFIEQHRTRFRMGTTALAAVLDEAGRQLHVANAGDCRAVLCRDGQATALTDDHKPSAPGERDRIMQAGGVVGVDPSEVNTLAALAPPRVYTATGTGGLAVSRAIGDALLKNVPGRPAVGADSLITAAPDVSTLVVRPPAHPHVCDACTHAAAWRLPCTAHSGGDRFLILASDGLWDVISNEDACAVVSTALAEAVTDPSLSSLLTAEPSPTRAHLPAVPRSLAQHAADVLVAEAYERGSADNITAVVVLLAAHPPDHPQAHH